MKNYTVKELQNAQSERAGTHITAANLFSAKCKASRMQIFQATVLVIEDASGRRIAVKSDGKWQ